MISNLVMSIVERKPSGFRITVEQPITIQCASVSLVSHLRNIYKVTYWLIS